MKNTYSKLCLTIGLCLFLFVQMGFSSNGPETHTDTDGKKSSNMVPTIALNFGNPATSTTFFEEDAITVDQVCRSRTEYQLYFAISEPPTGDATVSYSITGGTATSGLDYDLLTAGTMTFPDGLMPVGNFIGIRIWDDVAPEALETIEITLSISGGSNAVLDQTMITCTLADNDTDPNQGVITPIIVEDFAGGLPGGWQLVDNSGGGNWNWTDTGPAGSFPDFPLASTTAANGWMIFDSDAYGNDLNAESADLVMPVANCSKYPTVLIKFEQFFKRQTMTVDLTRVLVSSDNVNWTEFEVGNNDNLPLNGATFPNSQEVEIDISAVAAKQSTVYVKFRYVGDNNYHWQIDDVCLLGKAPVVIEEFTSNPIQEYLGPFGTAYYYSDDGELMLSIKNLENHDYGCTSVYVERDVNTVGDFTKEFWFTGVPQSELASKTFLVAPKTNKSDGLYEITLFYTEAEVLGYEGNTGISWGGTSIIKGETELSLVKPTNQAAAGDVTASAALSAGTLAFGSDYFITTQFNTGFSGFGVGDGNSVLPIFLLDWEGRLVDDYVQLDWSTQSETNNAGFEVQRSFDGVEFESLGFVEGAGTTINPQSYSFQDRDIRLDKQYYRLKQFDINGAYRYAKIIVINTDATADLDILAITPNPALTNFEISLNKEIEETITVQLFDMNGKLQKVLFEGAYKGRILNYENGLEGLAAGVYVLNIVGEKFSLTHRIIKTE